LSSLYLNIDGAACDSTAPATVWDYTKCMEVDSQFFYSGPPYDEIARVYIQVEFDVSQSPLFVLCLYVFVTPTRI